MLALLGFFPTYFGLFPDFPNTSWAIHFHVSTLIVWFALGVIQPILIRRQRLALHRTLGKVSYALVPLMCLGFVLAMNDGQARKPNPDLVLATMFDVGLFLFFCGMGISNRHRPKFHGRFMILTFAPFLNPSLGRLISPMVSVPIELLVILGLMTHALVRKREAKPYIVGAIAFSISLGGLMVLMTAAPELSQQLWQILFGA